MQKIMIVEDDPAIREELTLLLKNEGYCPLPITDFTNVAEQAVQSCPELILLDIGLPGQNGYAVCMELRKSVSAPIIFVTSRDSSLDEVQALSLGGDDYITKPYSIPVLMARIRAALRRGGNVMKPDVMEVRGLRLHLTKGLISTGSAEVENKTAALTRNELQILACLMEHAGEIVSRADLIEALWDNQIYIDDNTLSVNVTRLRGKLSELGLRDFIKTRRGMGYQL